MPALEKLDPDVDAFYKELLEKGNLTDEERKFLETLVTKDEVHQVFKSGTHATKRFQQEMDKAQKAQKSLEAEYSKKLGELDSLRTTLSQGTDLTKKEIETLKAQLRAKEEQVFKVRQKALEYGDGEAFLKEVGLDKEDSIYRPSPLPSDSPKKSDATQPAFSKEEFLKEMRGQLNVNTRELAKFNFDLLKMRDEYHSLTGKSIDLDELYTFITENINKYEGDYNKIYLEKYDIINLRSKKQEETLSARLEKEITERLEKQFAERSLPSEQRAMKESDFFKAIDAGTPEEAKKEIQSTPLGIGDRGSTISEAVKHFEGLAAKKEAAA